MYIVSTRAQFTDPDNHNTNNNNIIITECRDVDLRKGDLKAKVGSLADKVKGKKVLLLIHGYNSEWVKMLASYDILETNFKNYITGNIAYDIIIGFAWSGGDHGIEYPSAKQRAKDTIASLGYLLKNELNTASALDVESHSLGCYLALGALGYYSNPQNNKIIRNLFLLAPAVDNEELQKGEQFYNSSQACENCIIFHSKKDRVLGVWYRVAELDLALGFSGPEDVASIMQNSPNVKVVNCTYIGMDHSGYKHERKIYEYIKDELDGKLHGQFHTIY